MEQDRKYLNGAVAARKRADDWVAFTTDNPSVWEAGRTVEEAIGKLMISLSGGGRWELVRTLRN